MRCTWREASAKNLNENVLLSFVLQAAHHIMVKLLFFKVHIYSTISFVRSELLVHSVDMASPRSVRKQPFDARKTSGAQGTLLRLAIMLTIRQIATRIIHISYFFFFFFQGGSCLRFS